MIPESLRSFFPDAEIVDFVRDNYGMNMAWRVQEMLAFDPMGETGFCNSVRRSLTHEITSSVRG